MCNLWVKDDRVNVDEEIRDFQHIKWELCLLGRILTEMYVNFNGLQSFLLARWSLRHGTFNKDLIVLTRWKLEVSLKEFTFNEVDYWIQLYNLPLDYYTEATSKQLVKKIRNFRSYDNRDLIGKYIRVKVGLKLDQPLRLKITLERDNLSDLKVPIAYENLPKFCYYYRVPGHEQKECKKLFNDKQGDLRSNSFNKEESLAIICVQSTLGKIMEKIRNRTLVLFSLIKCSKQNLMNNLQKGKKNHQTRDPMEKTSPSRVGGIPTRPGIGKTKSGITNLTR